MTDQKHILIFDTIILISSSAELSKQHQRCPVRCLLSMIDNSAVLLSDKSEGILCTLQEMQLTLNKAIKMSDYGKASIWGGGLEDIFLTLFKTWRKDVILI